MRRLLLLISLAASFAASANERGVERLERISRYYSSMGNYSLSFVLRAGEGEQKGEIAVEGNNSYMRVADTEVYVVDSLRYEVRSSAKEIVVDRADAYEKELLDPLNGFASVRADYNIEECEINGRIAVRLTPKSAGETIYIITGVDGQSISSVRYGTGTSSAEVIIQGVRKSRESLPKFDKERYKGFEIVDFR